MRDAKTGFIFFNIQGHQYNYDAAAKSLSITNGRLLVSKEFANALGRPLDAGAIVGKISVGAAMQPIEITHLDENGDVKSASLPALNQPGVGTVPGPDVIVGELIGLEQMEPGAVNGQVGLALGTDACNKGTIDVDWFALPDNRHPFIPQNFYRMSGGADNTQTFEQIGQSWGKHAFTAASSNTCGFGCNGVGGQHLGSGCSDAYGAGLNGAQDLIGSRAWVNPFTGNFPSGDTSNDHSGHVHDVTSHRILVETSDLVPAQNQGATYFAEAQYVTEHEYTWCQTHPGECNMYNNVSYQQQSVSGGPTNFNFNAIGATVREQPAIMAWTGATVVRVEPDPGNDGIFWVGYKVTGPNAGVWHYEYAVYNQNLDRAIQSFQLDSGANPPATIATSDSTRHRSILALRRTAPKETLGIAAHRGMLLTTSAMLAGARKHLRKIRTRMQSASALRIISDSTLTSPQPSTLLQSSCSRQTRKYWLRYRLLLCQTQARHRLLLVRRLHLRLPPHPH